MTVVPVPVSGIISLGVLNDEYGVVSTRVKHVMSQHAAGKALRLFTASEQKDYARCMELMSAIQKKEKSFIVRGEPSLEKMAKYRIELVSEAKAIHAAAKAAEAGDKREQAMRFVKLMAAEAEELTTLLKERAPALLETDQQAAVSPNMVPKSSQSDGERRGREPESSDGCYQEDGDEIRTASGGLSGTASKIFV